MATHNLTIYHCLCCGCIMHGHSNVEPPQCCGQEMVKAAEQTIQPADRECIPDDEADSSRKTAPHAIKLPKKPR